MILENIIDAIGNTPLLSLEKYFNASIFAKCEFLNPGGSIKDRIAKFMIEEAEKEGELRPDMTICEGLLKFAISILKLFPLIISII